MPAFTHPPLNRPVTAIGGSYCLVREVRLAYRGREVLYLLGHAVVDASCCGPAGVGYALVAGFVEGWKTSRSDDDLPVSQVAPISHPRDRAAVRQRIEAAEGPVQVGFL